MMKAIYYKFSWISILGVLLISMVMYSCQKDDYYQDGGTANPIHANNILHYLKSNDKFDTLVKIIELAEMEQFFETEEITFFCPTDEVIRRTIGQYGQGGLNTSLFNQGRDTIQNISDIDAELWGRYLKRYVLKGKNKLKDFPQLDFGLRSLYPGGFYYTYDQDVVNVGVVFNSANGVKYTGYRQLSYSFLQNSSNTDSQIAAAVATSDIQCTNGVLHVLALTLSNNIGETRTDEGANNFGFGSDFMNEVILNR